MLPVLGSLHPPLDADVRGCGKEHQSNSKSRIFKAELKSGLAVGSNAIAAVGGSADVQGLSEIFVPSDFEGRRIENFPVSNISIRYWLILR